VTYVIAEPCVSVKDGACVEVCPVDCIHPRPDEQEPFAVAEPLYIDPDACTDCSLCADLCPVQAIFLDRDLPKKWQHYEQINADHYKNK
jgi:ferredoxin